MDGRTPIRISLTAAAPAANARGAQFYFYYFGSVREAD